MRLAGKVALVTGGGTGIGAAVVRTFTRQGASVVVTGRRRDTLAEIARETGAVAVAGDTSDRDDVERAVAEAVRTFGGLDVVVGNAGVGFGGSAVDATDSDWNRTIEVNLTGSFLLARAAVPAMLERGAGSIVLVSSVAALVGATDSAAYLASKTGMLGLVRSLAVDYGPSGIRANAVCPGWVRTPMADVEMDDLANRHGVSRDEAYTLATSDVPLRRPAEPEEIATCCLFLASDESSIVTGATLVADGGATVADVGTLAWSGGPIRGTI